MKPLNVNNPSFSFSVPLVIYPFEIIVSLGQTDQELKADLLPKYDLQWDDEFKMEMGSKGRCTLIHGMNQVLIRLYRYPYSNVGYGYLQHELFHAVSKIFQKIGVEFALGISDEAYAYLIGYLTEKIYDQI